jgi:hypothetical protein
VEEVRTAITDLQQRVVGIVHNAVDAQLSGSDQLNLTWTAEGLRQVVSSAVCPRMLLHLLRSPLGTNPKR